MKIALIALSLFTSFAAHAGAVNLTCRREASSKTASEKLFNGLKLKMQLPDTTSVAPGDFTTQKIAVTFEEGSQVVTRTKTFKVANDTLNASIAYGEDFGAGEFNLFWDYDAKEVVAVIVVSSDGPMNVDVQRCSVTP
jgi:hypothetical protein